MAAVAFHHVGKRYPNGVVALDDVSLEIADGELLVLVGPSGCGKSTLLRLLAGLETATTGEIRIDGQVVNDRAPQERNVAMVFQDYALYPFMTVRRNLAFPLEMRRRGRVEIDAAVERVAAMLDLGAVLDRLPRQLSGGQRQRVAMGRALVREPSVSLLDEPLSNLDAKLRVEVRAEIAALQQRTATTMLYVTHDQTEAMTLGERIAVLDGGRLQQVATPRELYERPANRFVAGFIGSPPMNIVAAAAAAPLSTSMPGAVVEVGIRPESFRLAAAGEPALEARIEHVEYLGHETLLHVAAGDVALVVRLPGMQSVAAGDAIRLAADALHCFDAGGNRIDSA
jgi:ABC-type sugar transport system ATPase subunit